MIRRPTAFKLASASYDANGNMTGYAGAGYSYDLRNRLMQANPAGGGSVQYGYDSTNYRIYKGAYASGSYSAEEIYFYGAEGHKYGTWQVNPSSGVLLKASVTKQWFGNRLLSPQDRLDSRGKYFPFGADRTGITPPNPPNDQEKFASYTRDSATSLDYANQRYYNSVTGRFMQPDPFGGSANLKNPQSWNRYAYVANDPANEFDPNGLQDDGTFEYEDWNQYGGGYSPVPLFTADVFAGESAPNGTSMAGPDPNGTYTISDTSACPPNCGSLLANIDEGAQMVANALSPITNNSLLNEVIAVGGMAAGQPELSSILGSIGSGAEPPSTETPKYGGTLCDAK